jgi:hypothetical protein
MTFLLSAATLIAADYGFTCPLRDSCLLLLCVGTDENCNLSAVRCPIGLKLSGDLGLVSQISLHVLVSSFDRFSYCKQTKQQKTAKIVVLQNLHFSPLYRVRLI